MLTPIKVVQNERYLSFQGTGILTFYQSNNKKLQTYRKQLPLITRSENAKSGLSHNLFMFLSEQFTQFTYLNAHHILQQQ